MRALKKILALAGLPFLLAGCFVSMNPLYTDKDIVVDPALEGKWTDERAESTWTYKPLDEKSYEATLQMKNSAAAVFTAHLVKVGKFLFIDYYPKELDIKNSLYNFHFVRGHTFYRVWLEKDLLRISSFNTKWLDTMVKRKKVKLSFAQYDNRNVLTASTKDIQNFILTYVNDKDSFEMPGEYKKVQGKGKR